MRDPERRRGVRLGDLDRSRVYRIGYVVERRRWEVLDTGHEPCAGRVEEAPGHDSPSPQGCDSGPGAFDPPADDS